MPKIGINLSDETAKRLKEYALKKTGTLRGQSEVAEAIIKGYLDEQGFKAPVMA